MSTCLARAVPECGQLCAGHRAKHPVFHKILVIAIGPINASREMLHARATTPESEAKT